MGQLRSGDRNWRARPMKDCSAVKSSQNTKPKPNCAVCWRYSNPRRASFTILLPCGRFRSITIAVKQLFCIWILIALGFNASAGILVQFRTTFGDLDVELYAQDKPVTVQNFIRYVQTGFYQNMFLHRCLPGFVVQGGGFLIVDPASITPFSATNGNLYVVPSFGPITNEFNVGRRLTNSYGTIAMAKLPGNPNSASSEWFFNLANNTGLDSQNGGLTVFGPVTPGTNL